MPILKKLKIKGASPKYIELLEHHLKELTSPFGSKITQRRIRLTSREIEICDMIKGGLASKDISELLNVSCQTIEKHRKNIRKKLGLSNKKVNLASHLQKI
jgi:DNA-binding NarL/FixJ family response regulator